MDEIHQLVNELSLSEDYDVEKLLCSMKYNVTQLVYFYCHLSKGKNPDDVVYYLNKKPHIHQLAYFNIGRGFPKELMDGHWCYILKDLGIKALVIPCTSIKKDSQNINPYFEKDIVVKDGNYIRFSRIQLSEIRTVDFQRLDLRKNFFTVLTPRKEITTFVKQNMFD